MKISAPILVACCCLVSGCGQEITGTSAAAISVEDIPRRDYISFFQKNPPRQHQELDVGPELDDVASLAKKHFRSIEPELLISGDRMYRDNERRLIYLTFDQAIPEAQASDPVPPPSQTDFYVVYIYSPEQRRFLGYAQHPGG